MEATMWRQLWGTWAEPGREMLGQWGGASCRDIETAGGELQALEQLFIHPFTVFKCVRLFFFFFWTGMFEEMGTH